MKIKRLCKLISYCLSFVLCCQLYSSVAFAQTKPVVQEFTQQEVQLVSYPYSIALNVPRYEQEKDHWCWAACIQMIASYVGVNISQSTICQRAHGEITDKGSNVQQMSQILDGIVSYIGKTSTYQYNYISYDEVKSRLSVTKTPFIADVEYGPDNRHAIVCYGYNNTTVPAMYFHDPWRSEKTSYSVVYSSAVTSAVFGSATGQWNRTVVYG